MNKDFPLQGSITYDIVDEAHKRILQIAIEVRNVLNRHNIPYSIFFGTLLGAVRHRGFIPWDMDMDFGAFENYEETVEILKRDLPSWLVVIDNSIDPNYNASWVKIADRYSEFHATMYEKDNAFKYKGLHVDLYNIKKTSYNNACKYRCEEAMNFYKRKLASGNITIAEYEHCIESVRNNYQKELSQRNILEKDMPEYAFIHLFEAPTDCVFPLKEYIFEGEAFTGPANYDRFLKGCYYKGDYMQLPPYEKRDLKMDEIIIKPIQYDK